MVPHFTVETPRRVGTACNRDHVERSKVQSIRDAKCEEKNEKIGSFGFSGGILKWPLGRRAAQDKIVGAR